MSMILCSNKKGEPVECTICDTRLVKNPNCSSDYYPTHIGIVLQSYCRNCGKMFPLIDYNPDIVSSTKKKRIATSVAYVYNLGFKETKQKALCIDTCDMNEFVCLFSKELGLPMDQVLKCCN